MRPGGIANAWGRGATAFARMQELGMPTRPIQQDGTHPTGGSVQVQALTNA